MKFVLSFLCFVLAIATSYAAIGSYDYCGKPCNDPPGITCAYNQRCYEVFIDKCAMKKRNCDNDERFLAVQMFGCLTSPNKCR